MQSRPRFVQGWAAVTRISVAMCTYNGAAAYLRQQLDSMEQQTRLPDELVVCDDRSTDSTVHILEEFAARAPFPVRITRNTNNLGSTKNFEQAIQLCSGDLIALSDQDDIWYPQRLARSEAELAKHPEVGLVFSDADLIDEQGQKLGTTIWRGFSFTESSRRELAAGDYTLALRTRFVTGATAMFRTYLREKCLPVGEKWIHDEWLAASIPLFADLRAIEEPLICYRKHVSQAVGPSEPMTQRKRASDAFGMFFNSEIAREKHWNWFDRMLASGQSLCRRFDGMPLSPMGAARFAEYQAYVRHLAFRMQLPASRVARFAPVLGNTRIYLRYAGVERIVKDLLVAPR